jgi:DNA repair exonuclease SbcCD ATPase subunit
MTDVSATNAQRAFLQTRLDVVTKLEARAKALTEYLAGAVAGIKAKKAEVNPFTRRAVAAQMALTSAEIAVKGFETDLELETKNVKIAETVAKVFSPAGVRAFLLDEVTPFLNDQTAKYLGTLSDGHITATWTTLIKTAKGELREKFSIEVTNSTGGDTFKGISGGEKRKVRIACALALQDLVARRATKPIELFIGDEIDDALDPAGIERLTVILDEKARERGSVFIISHSDLQCWIRNTITVTKKGEVSTFSEVTP